MITKDEMATRSDCSTISTCGDCPFDMIDDQGSDGCFRINKANYLKSLEGKEMEDIPKMSFFEVTDKAMKHFGSDMQVDKLIEEVGELQKALIKYKECGVIAASHVAEEMADVNMVMVPLQRALNLQKMVGDWTNVKLVRLNDIVNKSRKIEGYE